MRIARLITSLFFAVVLLAIPVPSRAQVAVGISVRIGPPVLPVYVQPICPGPGYIWVPGYWAYGPDGYFWVPGTWVFPPEVGLLWTPGYWGWDDGFYIWHVGYWGPVVGFYGGINYGFGYPGVGFYGGYWRGGTYFYNRSVTNVNVTVVHNVYERTVINERNVNRVSFNGGPGGINARPSSAELAVEHERHVAMTAEQTRHFEAARSDRSFLASVNHGRPDVAASPRPGEFHGHAAVENARPINPNRAPGNRVETNRPPANVAGSSSRSTNREDRPPRSSENNNRKFENRPPSSRPSNSAPVNPKLEQKQQRETDKMQRQQDADRQKLQQRHNQEQQRLQQRNANQQRQDQLQRRQQQQVQQMQQRHAQQTQKLQEHQQREVQRQQNKEPKGGRPQGR